MTTTTNTTTAVLRESDAVPLGRPAPVCPSWCTEHLEYPEDFALPGREVTTHRRPVQVGEVEVMIEETTGGLGGFEPVGPVVHVDPLEWISEREVRDLAAALVTAADVLAIPASDSAVIR